MPNLSHVAVEASPQSATVYLAGRVSIAALVEHGVTRL